jgi:hypothetical protein
LRRHRLARPGYVRVLAVLWVRAVRRPPAQLRGVAHDICDCTAGEHRALWCCVCCLCGSRGVQARVGARGAREVVRRC